MCAWKFAIKYIARCGFFWLEGSSSSSVAQQKNIVSKLIDLCPLSRWRGAHGRRQNSTILNPHRLYRFDTARTRHLPHRRNDDDDAIRWLGLADWRWRFGLYKMPLDRGKNSIKFFDADIGLWKGSMTGVVACGFHRL